MKCILPALLLVTLSLQTGFAQTHEEGFEAMMMEKWDKAIDIYSFLTKSNATDQEAWLFLSNAYVAAGDKAKALEALKSGYDAKPDGPMAYVFNARTLLFQGKPIEEIDDQVNRAFKKGKKDMSVLGQIGQSYLYFIPTGSKKPNYTRAQDLLKQALDVNGKDFNTLMALGYSYREQGDGGEAARQFEFASTYQPKNPLPFYMLGTVYKAGRLDQRYLENMDAAIALNNGYVPALRSKAEYYYFKKRKWEEARDMYKAILEKGGGAVIIEDEMQYANTLFLTKDYDGASEMVDKIIAKDQGKNYLRRIGAYSSYEKGDYKKGLEIMGDYFKKVEPENIIARDYIYYGRLNLKANNDTTAAIANLEKAMVLDTSEWALNEEIANLYYTQKDYCNAADHYRIWLDSLGSEGSAKAYYYLGLCRYYCKDDSMRYENALRSFMIITEKAPTASIGWYWAARSAAKLDIDPTVDTARVAEFGKAYPLYKKYEEVTGGDAAKYADELTEAYEYMVYYHFLRKEDTEARAYITKLLAIKPDNQTGTELLRILDEQSGGK